MTNTSGKWDQVSGILRDVNVDMAMEQAQTNLLYKKLLEDMRERTKEREWDDPNRVTIKSGEKNNTNKNNNDDEDSDSEFDDFFDDPEMDKLHQQRLEELKQQYKEKKQKLEKGHGHYDEMNERDMLKMACDTDYVVVNFYNDEFERCKIIDKHFRILAQKHIEARFVRVNVKKSPFIVSRWKIKTLPTIGVIINGIFADKIIGFDDFGNKDDFPTAAVAKRLMKSGVLKNLQTGKRKKRNKRTTALTDLE